MTTIKTTTGHRLRELRHERDLRQQDVADAVGCTLRGYGRYERNELLPPTDILLKLSGFFVVSTDYLLCRSDFKSGAAGEYFSTLTGLSDSAITALIQNRKSAAIEKKYIAPTVFQADPPAPSEFSTLPDTISYLLRPENQDIVFMIYNYLTADDIQLSDDLPPVLQTPNVNGSGLRLNTADVIRSALPNLIVQRLHDLRHDRLMNRNKKAGPDPTENKSSMKEGNEND